MSDWLYSDTVKEHFLQPKNMLTVPEYEWPCDGRGIIGNIKCGDQMLLLICVKDGVIVDCKWKTYGCASAIASTSILSEAVKGMKLEQAYKLNPQDIVSKLGGLPEHKIHCSVLGDKALRAAIDDYLEKNHLPPLKGTEATRTLCYCMDVTTRDVEQAYLSGAKTWEALQERTKIGTVCGTCKDRTLEYLHELDHLYGED